MYSEHANRRHEHVPYLSLFSFFSSISFADWGSEPINIAHMAARKECSATLSQSRTPLRTQPVRRSLFKRPTSNRKFRTEQKHGGDDALAAGDSIVQNESASPQPDAALWSKKGTPPGSPSKSPAQPDKQSQKQEPLERGLSQPLRQKVAKLRSASFL